MNSKHFLRGPLFFTLFFSVLFQTGCIFIPLIDGVKKIGVTKSDREALLSSEVKEFQDLVYWNKFQLAGAKIQEEVRSQQLKQLTKRYKDYRLVDSTIDAIDFDKDSDHATVTVTARRFKVPFYIVEAYTEDQTWAFSVNSGWKFITAKKAETSADASDEK